MIYHLTIIHYVLKEHFKYRSLFFEQMHLVIQVECIDSDKNTVHTATSGSLSYRK